MQTADGESGPPRPSSSDSRYRHQDPKNAMHPSDQRSDEFGSAKMTWHPGSIKYPWANPPC